MYAAKTRQVPLVTSVSTVQLLAPILKLGAWERFRLMCRGFTDSFGNKRVEDTVPTHTLHAMEHHHHQFAEESVRRANTLISLLMVEIAWADADASRTLAPIVTLPTHTELTGLQDTDRLLWAENRRQGDLANTARTIDERTIRNAQVRAVSLRIEVQRVVSETRAMCRQWEESHMHRAARYTRSRFAWSGRRLSPEPSVAGYRFTEQLDTNRGDLPPSP